MDIEQSFPQQRKRWVKQLDPGEYIDESYHFNLEKLFLVLVNNVLDSLTSDLQWQYLTLAETSSEF